MAQVCVRAGGHRTKRTPSDRFLTGRPRWSATQDCVWETERVSKPARTSPPSLPRRCLPAALNKGRALWARNGGVTDCLPGMYRAGPLPTQRSPGLLSEGSPLPQAPVHCHGATAACCTTLTPSTSFLPKWRCTAHGSALRFFTGQRKSKACSTRVCIKASSYLLMGGTIPLYQQAIIYLSSSAGKDIFFNLHYY